MQEVILAVSHLGWLSGELARGIIILCAVFITLAINIVVFFKSKIKRRQLEKRWEEQQRLIEARWRKMHVVPTPIKRRKDHPLTTIFRNEMPQKPTLSPNGIGPLGA